MLSGTQPSCTNWSLFKDKLQVGDKVRLRKLKNSCSPETMKIPDGTLVGMEEDGERDGYILVRVHGLHDPLKVHSSTVERVIYGFAAGDWVRLKEQDKKRSQVVRIWDPGTGSENMKWRRHTDNIRALLLDSTGRYCLSGSFVVGNLSFSKARASLEGSAPVPVYKEPFFTIPGVPAIIQHEIRNKRRHVLRRDIAGPVKLWEITRGVVMEDFGKVSFEDKKKELLEMVTKEAEQHEREIVALVSDMIIYSVNVMIYEEQVLELMMECEAFEIRMITEREMLMEEISSRNAYVVELHKRIASRGGENAELKAELSTYLPLVASLSDQISVLEEGTLLLSELNRDGKLEFMQKSRRSSEPQDNPSGALELQSLIARVEALLVVILEAKDRRDKELIESTAKLEAANVKIQEFKTSKGSCTGCVEQYMEDDRQKYDVDNSKGKQVQIMKDIELDQVSTCSSYGTGATVYPLGSDANAELDDEMLQLWENAEKDCKNQTAKSSSSEHDIQAVEEVKSEYPYFVLARGRDLGIDRLEISTVSLEPHQLWRKTVLEKLTSDAQRLSTIQASIDEVKQKMEGTSKGKSPMSSEYSSIRAQLQEIEGFVLEQIDFNSNLTKKAENYPAWEVNSELEGYSSRFYGPFQVLQKVGRVAYKLHWPEGVEAIPMFRSSFGQQGWKIEDRTNISAGDPRLPRQDRLVTQWLVQWENLPLEDASWEDADFIKGTFPEFYSQTIKT